VDLGGRMLRTAYRKCTELKHVAGRGALLITVGEADKVAWLRWTADVIGFHLLYMNKIRTSKSYKLHKEIIFNISFTLSPRFENS